MVDFKLLRSLLNNWKAGLRVPNRI
jgi:hypothetical protein